MKITDNQKDKELFQKHFGEECSFFETLTGDKKLKSLFTKINVFGDSAILCPEEACLFLGVTRGSLNNMVYRGQLKRSKLGNSNRFKFSDLKEVVRE